MGEHQVGSACCCRGWERAGRTTGPNTMSVHAVVVVVASGVAADVDVAVTAVFGDDGWYSQGAMDTMVQADNKLSYGKVDGRPNELAASYAVVPMAVSGKNLRVLFGDSGGEKQTTRNSNTLRLGALQVGDT